MFKKIITTAGFIFLTLNLFNPVNASSYPSSYTTRTDPTQVIIKTVDKIKKFNTSSSEVPAEAVRGFLESEIIPLFDFDSMATWITGPYVKYMTKTDQVQFYTNLKDTFLGSLSNHLGSFDAEKTQLRYSRARYKFNGEAIVSAQVFRKGQYPARLEFRMKNNGNQWKVIDVKANGTSAVMYYRTHFINELRQYGR